MTNNDALTPQSPFVAQDDVLMRSSWAQMKLLHTNPLQSTRITMRADIVEKILVLEEEMRREDEADQWTNRIAVAPKIAKRIQELEAEARSAEVTFTFRGLGSGELAKLQAAHPATDEVKARLGSDDLEWNPETFTPALMAASCVSPPELANNLPEWVEINETWSNGQVMRLWTTCMSANSMGADTPKSSRASEVLRRGDSGNSSTTALR